MAQLKPRLALQIERTAILSTSFETVAAMVAVDSGLRLGHALILWPVCTMTFEALGKVVVLL